MESETFAGFRGADRVPEGGVIINERAQRVPRPGNATTQPRIPYQDIRQAWSSTGDKKSYTLPPAGYSTKRTDHAWQAITLDRSREAGTTPSREHFTKMASFGRAVRNSPTTRTLFEEGIESVVNRMLNQHMGKVAFTKWKAQLTLDGHAVQSHHLATPQVGHMPVNDPSWLAGTIDCPTMTKPVQMKTARATSADTLKSALNLYIAQEYHRDYADASCEVGCMTVLTTTACNARVAIIEGSHKYKEGKEYVATVADNPLSQQYVVIEIPPHTMLVMDSYLFHAGCRYFTEDHQKKQGRQIGESISYRSHHYIVPDAQVNPSNETGVRWNWWK